MTELGFEPSLWNLSSYLLNYVHSHFFHIIFPFLSYCILAPSISPSVNLCYTKAWTFESRNRFAVSLHTPEPTSFKTLGFNHCLKQILSWHRTSSSSVLEFTAFPPPTFWNSCCCSSSVGRFLGLPQGLINIVQPSDVYSGVPKSRVSEVVGQSSLEGGQPAGSLLSMAWHLQKKGFSW